MRKLVSTAWRISRPCCLAWFWLWCLLALSPDLQATDHILTIGGGYAPEGNQASLEANVLFFQRVIATSRPQSFTHRIQFADGFDPSADLQIALAAKTDRPEALRTLEEIFAPPGPPGSQRVGYRNHRVPQISGSNRINDVRNAMEILKAQVRSGDRLIVYVTAHGGSAKGDDPFDTSISCWGNRELNMREVAEWLDSLPKECQVILVMAQCYCGGFANTVFAGGDREDGLAKNLRTGFFAQRHDLPAAGCRPDIENDEEYSSYFWGALIGQTRSGKPIQKVDCNGDGRISLAEAHAYAVVASETIDIPLRGSDALLREISRIAYYDLDESQPGAKESQEDSDDPKSSDANNGTEDPNAKVVPDAELLAMSGTLGEFLRIASPVQRRILEGLAAHCGMNEATQLSQLFSDYNQAQRDFREARRGGFGPGRRGRGGFNRRREVREAILEKWPDLEDQKQWSNSPLLIDAAAQAAFLKELKMLPTYEAYLASRTQREQARETTFKAEMRQVRLRRLIHTLESVLLAANLSKVATPELVQRYQKMIQLEESFF